MLRKLTLLMLLGLAACNRELPPTARTLIPLPDRMTALSGEFAVEGPLTIAYETDSLRPAAELLQTTLFAGIETSLSQGKGDVQLRIDTAQEGYTLKVLPRRIVLTADRYSNLAAGIATLSQLQPAPGAPIPCLKVEDAPRLAWRGVMIDAARHFFTPDEIRRILDYMALYKFNKFHWHLTDDQGWRLQIDRYPLLTERGGWRTFDRNDRACMAQAAATQNPDMLLPADRLRIEGRDTLYGGYYTKEEVRDIVRYAAQRGIDVIPEVDMPGHCLKAIENYAGLSCTSKIGWGETFSTPLCPGKDRVLEFCRNVYSEVFELFPSRYIHIGADEVERANWTRCPDCQRRMQQEGLRSEAELHAWFVHQMEEFFRENGRVLIGWDEILEGGLSPTSVVQWWRSWKPLTVSQATAHGNRVIVSANEWLYLSGREQRNSFRRTYGFEPVQDTLSDARQQLIMGVQAHVWSERVPSEACLQYRLFPRLLAVSELAWSSRPKDEASMRERMAEHCRRLDEAGVNYRIPDPEGIYDCNSLAENDTVRIVSAVPGIVIRYAGDGTIPTSESALYTPSMTLSRDTTFTFRMFHPDGHPGDTFTASFVAGGYAPASEQAATEPGLRVRWYDYGGESCAEIDRSPLKTEMTHPDVSIPEGVTGRIGLVFTGWFDAPEDGVYTFRLNSDDGSTLQLDGRTIIDNDGPHSIAERRGQAALAKGLHPIEVRYFDSNGGALEMGMLAPDGTWQPIDPARFRH